MNRVIKEEQEIKVIKNLEDLHKQLFILLCEFDDFCKENNIKYSLTSGTLIGAIRGKGFIPWDDDIDVMMDRENYEKFTELCINKLNNDPKNPLKFDDYRFDCHYTLFFSRFVKTNVRVETRVQIDSHPYLYEGLCLDVFPFDYVNDSKILKPFMNIYIKFLHSASRCKTLKVESIKTFIKKVLFFPFSRKFLRTRYRHLVYKGQNRYAQNKSVAICSFNFFRKNSIKTFYYDQNIFNEFVSVKFEGRDFPVIKDYDVFLRKIFGNYMVPPKGKDRKPQHSCENKQ